jgi:hypothetical protein
MQVPSPPPWGLSYAAAPLLLPGVAATSFPRSIDLDPMWDPAPPPWHRRNPFGSRPLSSSLGFRLLNPRCPAPRVFLRRARPNARDGVRSAPRSGGSASGRAKDQTGKAPGQNCLSNGKTPSHTSPFKTDRLIPRPSTPQSHARETPRDGGWGDRAAERLAEGKPTHLLPLSLPRPIR